MCLVRGASCVGAYTPLGLEFTRQRPTHSLEEELFLHVSFSVSLRAVCPLQEHWLCPLPSAPALHMLCDLGCFPECLPLSVCVECAHSDRPAPSSPRWPSRRVGDCQSPGAPGSVNTSRISVGFRASHSRLASALCWAELVLTQPIPKSRFPPPSSEGTIC